MFNRIFIAMGAVAVSAMILIGGSGTAQAAFINWAVAPASNGNVVTGNTYRSSNGDTLSAGGVSGTLLAGNHFTDTYDFSVGLSDLSVLFGMDTTFADPTPNQVGIANLEFNFYDTSSLPVNILGANMTDANGVAITGSTNIGREDWYMFSLLGLRTYSLVVTGDVLTNGGSYLGSLSAVPLPPSAILFGTALFGIGALRRRKDKKATGLKATGMAA